MTPVRALRDSGLAGVSFVEVFGIGQSREKGLAGVVRIASENPQWDRGVVLGVQPHAPYSCDLQVYGAAADTGLPLATHLAETWDELEFVAHATGTLEQMLKRIGIWDQTISGSGLHPIDHLAEVLRRTPAVVAHLNHIETRHLDLLASWPITVAYCPRASAYFEPQPARSPDGQDQHRYRDMINAGVNVALGTDSILCLDTPSRLSVLDEMRLLSRRDGIEPSTLLKMGTINGARGLGFDPSLFTLQPGSSAGVLAIDIDPGESRDPLATMLSNTEAPRWIAGPFQASDAWRFGSFETVASR